MHSEDIRVDRPPGPAWRADLVWGCALAILVLAASMVWVSSRLGLVHKPRYVLETDHLVYIEMAKQPLGGEAGTLARSAPFCWRILTPALARGLMRLGLRVHGAYYLLTQAGLAALLVLLFLLLRARGCRREEAALGVTLVGLLPGAVRWYEYQYWMTDPLALATITLALLVFERGRERQLLWIGTLSVLARESYVLALPYFVVRRWRERGAGAALATLLWTGGVPVAALLLVRALIVPDAPPHWGTALAEGVAYRLRHLGVDHLYAMTIGSFGAMVLAPLAWSGDMRVALRRRLPDLVYVGGAGATLLVASNTERLLAYALPVVAPLFLRALRSAPPRIGLSWRALALVAIALQAQLFVETPFRRPGLSVDPRADVSVMASFTLVAVAGLALRLRRSVSGASRPR